MFMDREKTHERISEFASLAHTRLGTRAVIRGVESDTVKKHEAYPAEDVEMDLTGAGINPMTSSGKSSRRNTQCRDVGNHAYPQESGTSQQGIALSRFANWWNEQDRDSSGE